MTNLKEIVGFLVRPHKILTPLEIIERANTLSWKNGIAFQALREISYVGELQAKTRGNWELYWDYGTAQDLLNQTRAVKIWADRKAPEHMRSWAEKIIQEVIDENLENAHTPLDEYEEHSVFVKGGKVYEWKNIVLPK